MSFPASLKSMPSFSEQKYKNIPVSKISSHGRLTPFFDRGVSSPPAPASGQSQKLHLSSRPLDPGRMLTLASWKQKRVSFSYFLKILSHFLKIAPPEQEGERVPSSQRAALLFRFSCFQSCLRVLEVRQNLLCMLRVEGEDSLPVRLVPERKNWKMETKAAF